jgi:hypothetical protein
MKKMHWQLAIAAGMALGTAHAQVPSQVTGAIAQVNQAAVDSTNDCQGYADAAFQGQRSATDLTGDPVDGVFWPPNHKLRTVKISAEETADDGDACNVTITDVRQDEAIDGQGDGNTSPDAANCSNAGDESKVDLRGERSGLGTGRFYTITYLMDDPDDNAPNGTDLGVIPPKQGTATLLVPHDMGVAHFGTYVDEGGLFPSYSGTFSCPE